MNDKVLNEATLAYAEKDREDLQVFAPDGRWSDQRRSNRWEDLIQDLRQSVVLSIIVKICLKVGKGQKAVIDVVGPGCIADDAPQAPLGNELVEVLLSRRHCEERVTGANIVHNAGKRAVTI